MTVTVEALRQGTQRERRRQVIRSLSLGFSLVDSSSPLSRLAALLSGSERILVANSDVDGLTSAMMLSAVAKWKIGVLVDKSGFRVSPALGLSNPFTSDVPLFGVDVFSLRFPGVSNHPIHFGLKPRDQPALADALQRWDSQASRIVAAEGIVNPSAWLGIRARTEYADPLSIRYKYPLGTAQLVLAALEVVGQSPRFFDRQYLPWLVANCDGGLKTIRDYPWNAEVWWSALAAVVGPHSLSESLYRIATEQRPNEFLDLDRRLRYDEPDRSSCLNMKWNLVNATPKTLQDFASMVGDLSGWEDPFLGGAESLDSWASKDTTGNALSVDSLTRIPTNVLDAHLSAARDSIHSSFSTFPERGVALGWRLDHADPAVEAAVGGSIALDPDSEGP